MRLIDARIRLPFEYRKVSEEEQLNFYAKYNEVLHVGTTTTKTTETLLEEMDEAGVTHGVVHAEFEFGENANQLNQAVAQVVEDHPDRFKGFGTVQLDDPRPMKLVKQAQEIKQLGLIGINLQPVFFDIDPLDRRLYPLYSVAHELGLILSFHTGVHYSTAHPFQKNSPMFIDQIAVDFPGIKIIACHSGWPWTNEMVAIARRHANVYLEFGGVAPKYIAKNGTGWEPIFSTLNSLLSKQILFGTDWPVISMERAKEEWLAMGLQEKTIENLFSDNASRLFGFESTDRGGEKNL